ncbi:MAG: LemA family protein [Spirochaetaceae bacterium]|jgi:LemA protein|nr:LemA family protein [Spirochaetaceae bacterium]
MSGKPYRWVLPVVIIVVVVFMAISSFSGTYNKMVQLEESVKASWGQVENVYQRRMDLIPNLVETVKGYASHENETFTAVTEARAKAGGVINVSDEVLKDPAAFQRFQQAQGQLTSALQRLMVVSEQYPDLKANESFLALQDQLEGSENRIAVERKRFNEVTQSFNTYIKQFPRMMIANMSGFDEIPYFQASEGADAAPAVSF